MPDDVALGGEESNGRSSSRRRADASQAEEEEEETDEADDRHFGAPADQLTATTPSGVKEEKLSRTQAEDKAKPTRTSAKLDKAKTGVEPSEYSTTRLRSATASPLFLASMGSVTTFTFSGLHALYFLSLSEPSSSFLRTIIIMPLLGGLVTLFLTALSIKADTKRREQLSELLQKLDDKGHRLRRANLRSEVLEWAPAEHSSE
jgi:hypothetical protein